MALARNIYNASEPHAGARRLAVYTRAAATMIGEQDVLNARALRFPDPETIAPVRGDHEQGSQAARRCGI
jgi:hypothetical protein